MKSLQFVSWIIKISIALLRDWRSNPGNMQHPTLKFNGTRRADGFSRWNVHLRTCERFTPK